MSNEAKSEAMGCLTTVFIVLVVLKITGLLHRSWWFVTAPLWIPWVCIAFIAIAALLYSMLSDLMRKR